MKLNLTIVLKRYGMQNLALFSWRNSTWGRIKKLDWTQPMRGELNDCYSGFTDKSLLLDESRMITERNSLVVRVYWQELSRSWTV